MSPTRSLLVCSTHYWPEATGNAPYVTEFAEHLAARGHAVSVISGFQHYPEWRSTAGRRFRHREARNSVEIRRRWHYVPQRQSALRRALYEASITATGFSGLGIRKPDAIVAVVPTLAAGAIACAAAKMYRVPLGIVFQDLVGPGAEQNGVRGGKRLGGVLGRTEMVFARQAARVGVITEGFATYLQDGGIRDRAIRLLPNWTHSLAPAATREATRKRLGWEPGEFVCLHAGNMGQKQGLDNLLDAAAVIAGREAGNVRIVLSGDGNDRPRLEARVRDEGLRNVSFVNLQPDGEYEAMLASADLLIAHQRGTVTNAALPSKLTSYFAAGRAVLAVAAAQSQAAREVERSGAGLVVEPEDPGLLADTLLDLAAHPQALACLGERARHYACTELGRERALQRYEAFVNELWEGNHA